MKKLLLTLGAIASVAAPVAAVVACGSDKPVTPAKIAPSKGAKAETKSVDQTEITEKATKIVEAMDADVTFDGKTYIDYEALVKAWVASTQKFVLQNPTCIEAGYVKVTYSMTEDGVIVNLIDKNGVLIQSTKDAYGPLKDNNGVGIYDFKTYTHGIFAGIPGFKNYDFSHHSTDLWSEDHKLIVEHPDGSATKTQPIQVTKQPVAQGTKQPSQAPVVEENADDELADEASKQTDTEATTENFLRVGGDDITTWNNGVIGLEKASGGEWTKAFAELRAGDYIDFVFKDASDINTFSSRVFYDNTLAPKNISAHSTMESMYFNKFVVRNGVVEGLPEATGQFQTEGAKGDVSIFNLKAVKKNVIRMTFNDVYDKPTTHLDAQLIYLKGFSDIDGDGDIDLDDRQMTPSFAIDGGIMYNNYLQPYKTERKNYWHKGVTVGMHDQTIIDYLNK